MADIAPNSTIKMLKDVPLDETYEHTIYFGNTSAELDRQLAYFESKVKYTYSNNTYQRVNKGKLRISQLADDLYDCNYMMFQNTNFGSKWFYCFVKSVEYINNSVAEIEYEIDVMQTWNADYSLQMCYVEREHSETDHIGDNTVPENLEIGEYFYESKGKMWGSMDGWSIIVAATFELGSRVIEGITKNWDVLGDAYPGFYNRYFSGIHFNVIPADDAHIQEFYDTMHSLFNASKIDEIVGIFMMPTNVVSSKSSSMQIAPTEITKSIEKSTSWNYGSSVKNNKLYTYPYNCLYVTSSDGNSATYKYEYFNSENCNFSCECAMGIPPECGLIPKDYQFAITTSDLKNHNYTLMLKKFPMCSWANDAFLAWLSQTTTSLLGAASVGVATAAIAPEMLPMVASNLGGAVGNSVGGLGKALLMPDHAKGENRNILSLGNLEFGYHFYNARIKNEYAKIIDEYFNRFGYATKLTKIPNRNSRPHWNYVKTIGCTLTGSLPADTARKICSIYDNGITFWKYGSEVGDYSLNNKPNAFGGGA